MAEGAMLRRFWAAWEEAAACGHPRVGFNANFDLSFALIRSLLLEVDAPRVTLKKYGSPDVVDLMLELSFGVTDFKSLDFWTKRFRLTEIPDDTITGADIAGLVAQDTPEAWAAITAHNHADVVRTLALAKRLHPGVGR